MLLTIHNLPPQMRYADIKSLITSKCGFKEVILDNLVAEGRGKKVTVGLAEEEDAAMLVRQINGLYLEGMQLYVVDVRHKKSSEQPFRQTHNYESSAMDNQRSNNQQSNYSPPVDYQIQMNYQQAQYMNQLPAVQMDSYSNQPLGNADAAVPAVVPYTGAMYYTPQGQNSYMDYTGQTQQFSSSATQYPQFSGQYGQVGSGANYQTPKEDTWSRKRKGPDDEFNESSDNDRDNESTYAFGNRQQSAWDRGNNQQSAWDRGNNHNARADESDYDFDHRQQTGWDRGNNDPRRRRSRSPANNRDRPPKRTRDEYYGHDSSRKTSNTKRNSQQYSPDRKAYSGNTYGSSNQNELYTPQTYSGSNQNKPYYDNNAVTASSSNSWNARTNTSAFQQQTRDGFSDQNPSFEKKPQGNSWDNKATSSTDSQSNYRKHLEHKAAQGQSKSDWRNPAQTSWGAQNSASQEPRSKYKWESPDASKKVTSLDGQKGAPVGENPKVWERSQFDKPKPVKNAKPERGSNNYLPPGCRPKKQKKGKPGMMPLIKQDSNARFEAAGKIAYEIEKAHPDLMIKKEYVRQLKKSVRSRLDILLAEKLGESIPQMVSIYRAKFPKYQDRAFCELVTKQVSNDVKPTVDLTGPNVKTEQQSPQAPKKQLAKQAQPNTSKSQPNSAMGQSNAAKSQSNAVKSELNAVKSELNAVKSELNTVKSEPNANRPGDNQSTPSKPVLPSLQVPNPTNKLPKYPNADKQVYKEQKKLKKLEYQNDALYELPHPLQEALDEELKIISDIFKSQVTADSELEEAICERFLTIGLDQVRKVIKLNVTKRLLNITTNLIIRVLVSGKPPKKQDVELFLRSQNVVSLKKSGKKAIVYVATCSNYATYDRLLGLGTMPLNNETILKFKPFQLVGPKLSYRERTERRAQRLRGVGGSNTNDAANIQDCNVEDNDIEIIETEDNDIEDNHDNENDEMENNDTETTEMGNTAMEKHDEMDNEVDASHEDQGEGKDDCVIVDEAIDNIVLNDEDFEDY